MRRSQVYPRQVTSLSSTGIEEHRRTTRGATPNIRAAVGTAAVVAAIDSDPGGDAVHPAQAALGISVGLNASGRLAVERPRQYAVSAIQAVIRRRLLQHRGVEAAMHKQCAIAAEPRGSNSHFGDDTLVKLGG